jgi:hypothetical protein
VVLSLEYNILPAFKLTADGHLSGWHRSKRGISCPREHVTRYHTGEVHVVRLLLRKPEWPLAAAGDGRRFVSFGKRCDQSSYLMLRYTARHRLNLAETVRLRRIETPQCGRPNIREMPSQIFDCHLET